MRQIEEFGQAPAQLFKSPHPRRLSIAQAEVVRPIASPVPGSNTEPLADTVIPSATASSPGSVDATREPDSLSAKLAMAPPPPPAAHTHSVVSYPRERVSRGAVLAVSDLLPWTERLVTVDARRAIGFHGWRILPPERSPPFRLRPDAVEADDGVREHDGGGGGKSAASNGEGGSTGAGGAGGGRGGASITTKVRRLGVPFAPDGVASSRLLEPPPHHGRSSEYGLRGDRNGGVFFTRPLRGLGGSYDSLASMGSLLSLPQSTTAAASEPLQHSSSGASLLDGYNGCHHDNHRQDEHDRPRSLVPLLGAGGDGSVRGVGGSGIGRVGLGSHLFAFHAESRLLFSGGYWDSSFRVNALDGRLVVSIARHRDVVTSLSLADGGAGCRRLVTASRDTTLMVWRVDDAGGLSASSLLHVLYGHDAPVTCVCARASLDVIVSSGEDGTLVVHNLWDGEYVRTITPQQCGVVAAAAAAAATTPPADGSGRGVDNLVKSAGNDGEKKDGSEEKAVDKGESVNGCRAAAGGVATRTSASRSSSSSSSSLPPPWPSVEWVGLSTAGYIVAYSPADATLRSYTVNGHASGVVQVAKAEAGPLHAFVFSEDGSVLLSGGHDRVVTLRWAHSLRVANDGGREGCGEAVLDGSGPPLAGVPAASAGVKKFCCAVRSLALTAGERHLLVGLDDGTLGVLALDANYLRQRLRSKLDQLGI